MLYRNYDSEHDISRRIAEINVERRIVGISSERLSELNSERSSLYARRYYIRNRERLRDQRYQGNRYHPYIVSDDEPEITLAEERVISRQIEEVQEAKIIKTRTKILKRLDKLDIKTLENPEECILCCDNMRHAVILPDCKHQIHLACLVRLTKSECPLCRQKF